MADRYYNSTALPTVLAANLGASGNPSVISLPGTWPTEYPFCVLIDWGTSAQEAILVTSAPTGTGPYTLPCTRGIDLTLQQAHNAGAQAEHGTTGYEPTLLQTLSGEVATLAGEVPSLPVSVADGGTGTGTAAQNDVFAGPSSGGTGSPSFRALVSADIPNNAANTTGTAAGLSSTLAVGSGGTGSATQNWQGLLTPVTQTTTYTATAGQLVKANIASASWTLTLPAAPAANTIVGAKVIAQAASGVPWTLTIACGGSDRFEQSGGATTATMSLLSQAAAWQYNGGYWTRLSDDLPLSGLSGLYQNVFSPMAYGAAGNGTTDDTTAVQACAAATAAAGGVMDLGDRIYLTSSPVTIGSYFHLRSSSWLGGITNSTSAVFTVTGTVNYVTIEKCFLTASAGHVFNAAAAPVCSFWKIRDVLATQSSASYGIWYQKGGAFIDCLIEGKSYLRAASMTTVSPMTWIQTAGDFNDNRFAGMRCLGSSSATVPFFSIDPGYGAHTDTVTISTGTPNSVADSSAVSADLGLNIYSAAYPAGSSLITAVAAGTGYTVATGATSSFSGSALVGFEGIVEDVEFTSVTWEVCAGGGVAMTGAVDVAISMCYNWDIPSAGLKANFYSFTKSLTGYACANIAVHGGRSGGGSTNGSGFSDFYADSSSFNILIDSFGVFGNSPVITSPAAQTTIINAGSAGISGPALGGGHPGLTPGALGLGLLTVSPLMCTSSSVGVTAEEIFFILCTATQPVTVAHLGVLLTRAGTSPGSGVNQLALYTEAGTLAAQTGDMTTQFEASVPSFAEGAIANPGSITSYTLTQGANYYLAVTNNFSGTTPEFGTGGVNSAAGSAALNGHYLSGYLTSQAVMPGSITPSSLSKWSIVYCMYAR